jgi:hypothetical protein
LFCSIGDQSEALTHPYLARAWARAGRTCVCRRPAGPRRSPCWDEFLLLGVDRDRRLPCRQRFLHPIVDVVELRIAIGMLASLARLAVGLQAIATADNVRPML